MNIKILAKLYSKRNQVYKIRIDKEEKNQLAIMKVFSSDKEKLLDIEYRNIEMLYDYGINLPKIICKDKNRLIMEYIEGDLINDLVERLDTEYGLINWHYGFPNCTKYLRILIHCLKEM